MIQLLGKRPGASCCCLLNQGWIHYRLHSSSLPWLVVVLLVGRWAAWQQHGQELVGFSRWYTTLVKPGLSTSLAFRVQPRTLQAKVTETGVASVSLHCMEPCSAFIHEAVLAAAWLFKECS